MNDEVETARDTLRKACKDPDAGWPARVSAARTLLEIHGILGRLQEKTRDDRPLADLEASDLEAEYRALKGGK